LIYIFIDEFLFIYAFALFLRILDFILMDWLSEIIFKDFKALRNFCKSVVIHEY